MRVDWIPCSRARGRASCRSPASRSVLVMPLAAWGAALLLACNPDEIVIPRDLTSIDAGLPTLDAGPTADDRDHRNADAGARHDAARDASEPGPRDARVGALDEAQLDAAPASEGDAALLDAGMQTAEASGSWPDAGGQTSCPDGLPRGPATGLQTELAEHAPTIEGVAVCPGGGVYVSSSSNAEIWRVPVDGGEPVRWAAASGRMFAGLTCDSQGRLFVADFGRSGSSLPRGAILFDREDALGIALPPPEDDTVLAAPNGIVAVPERGVYLSDTTGGLLALYREQNGAWRTSIVARELPGANGLAYASQSKRLYVALSNFLGGDNAIVSFAVAQDGTLADKQTLWSGPNVVDGIAVDEQGGLYVAFYSEGKVVRLADGAVVGAAGHPASFAFRGGALLFTDYDVVGATLESSLGTVFTTGWLNAIQLGVCGAL
jgi:sugar lactone lactonase YvrE